MKKFITILALPLPMLAACEKYTTTVYVNTDAQCCGVSDPMNNIPWLRELGDEAQENVKQGKRQFSTTYMLFTNDTTGENMIVEDGDVWVIIYDCEGEKRHGGSYTIWNNSIKENGIHSAPAHVSPEPCVTCAQFFETHTFIDTIANYSITLK